MLYRHKLTLIFNVMIDQLNVFIDYEINGYKDTFLSPKAVFSGKPLYFYLIIRLMIAYPTVETGVS